MPSHLTRRTVLKSIAAAFVATPSIAGCFKVSHAASGPTPFELPYPVTALEQFLPVSLVSYHVALHRRYIQQATPGFPTNSSQDDLPEFSQGVSAGARTADRLHRLYWHSMRPSPGTAPAGAQQILSASFGGEMAFRAAVLDAARSVSGKGWVLVHKHHGRLEVVRSMGHSIPDASIVWACDLWPHSYSPHFGSAVTSYANGFLDHLAWNRLGGGPQFNSDT